MTSDARYVFDTNTIISAFLFSEGNPAKALSEALNRGEVILSLEVVEEVSDVLRREKFDRHVRRKVREEFLKAFIRRAFFVDVAETIEECRDPKDDKFLELAVSGGASHIITGDQDLLVLHPFRSVSILTPRQFLDSLSLPDS